MFSRVKISRLGLGGISGSQIGEFLSLGIGGFWDPEVGLDLLPFMAGLYRVSRGWFPR